MYLLNMFTGDFWSLLCRGRKKKIFILIIILVALINAMFYVSLELYNTVKRKNNKDTWLQNLRFNDNSYVDGSGMRVIVGHYIGGNNGGNLSDEVINENRYSPVEGAGEGGRPVQLSPRELITAKELFVLHGYNILIGDKISINRKLPDMRSASCRSVEYAIENFPTTSVIIVYHNEAWSTLMRTVMSVLVRSPEQLLKEIILVDDASERRYLGKELDDAVAALNKVKIIRSKERKGLVGARLIGAKEAKGDVLLFLDAHCEVTEGWLEPLLERAGSDDVFICPHIDIISYDTFAYTKSIDAHWGAFSWKLLFRWLNPGTEVLKNISENPSKPYPTPAMAGGLFAVRKSLFWRLGSYDEGMMVWGGENLELSWRAWQCGARIEISPCSRVGHIFRTKSPYKYPGGVSKVLNSNLARAATVWMDEWADFVFKFNPSMDAVRDQQNLANRSDIRKNLSCKTFEWYLQNIWPQHFFPTKDRWFGRIKNERGACLGVLVSKTPGIGGPATGVHCGTDSEIERLVIFTPDGKVMADEGLCLEQIKNRAYWIGCKESKNQIWVQNGPRLKTKEGLCLTLAKVKNRIGIDESLNLKKCVKDDGQIWHFERVPWR